MSEVAMDSDERTRTEEAQVVWIVDDDRSIRWVLERALTQAGMQVRSFESADLTASPFG